MPSFYGLEVLRAARRGSCPRSTISPRRAEQAAGARGGLAGAEGARSRHRRCRVRPRATRSGPAAAGRGARGDARYLLLRQSAPRPRAALPRAPLAQALDARRRPRATQAATALAALQSTALAARAYLADRAAELRRLPVQLRAPGHPPALARGGARGHRGDRSAPARLLGPRGAVPAPHARSRLGGLAHPRPGALDAGAPCSSGSSTRSARKCEDDSRRPSRASGRTCIAASATDLREWLRRACGGGGAGRRGEFELAFGLCRTARSGPAQHRRAGRARRRHPAARLHQPGGAGRRRQLRATDYKTGKGRAEAGTVIGGGRRCSRCSTRWRWKSSSPARGSRRPALLLHHTGENFTSVPVER